MTLIIIVSTTPTMKTKMDMNSLMALMLAAEEAEENQSCSIMNSNKSILSAISRPRKKLKSKKQLTLKKQK